jgi:D-alanyl-D-alanine carboxypeptidase/D-alanyl-D-alanine carboxypeptidase (penicillin-binding protein 5/6)
VFNVRATGVSVSARSAIVMVAATGEVLFSKNEREKRGVASTTKIMTAVVALENANLADKINASETAITVEGTSIGLQKGNEVNLHTLLYGMLLESGNDAANVTAELVSGDKAKFAELMNKKAEQLGMLDTSFKNPSGLPEKDHYSTAYDMALLGSYAVKNPVFMSICSSESYIAEIDNPTYETTFYNHNKLLNKYDGAFGIKTGFTRAAGRCLVSAVERNGIVLVAVTLNAYDDWNDHIKLYDYCFDLLSVNKIDLSMAVSNMAVVNSKKSTISLRLLKNLSVPYYQTIPEYEVTYYIPRFVYAGIRKGDYIGWAEVYTKSGMLVDKIYIVAGENAPVINSIEKDRR